MRSRSSCKGSRQKGRPSVGNAKTKLKRPLHLQRLAAIDESDDDANSVPFVDVKEFDVAARCPVFSSSVADRETDEVHIASEDLDSLQFELESILVHVASCQRELEDALQQLAGKPSTPSSARTLTSSSSSFNAPCSSSLSMMSTSSLPPSSSKAAAATTSRLKPRSLGQDHVSSSPPLKRQRTSAPQKSKFKSSFYALPTAPLGRGRLNMMQIDDRSASSSAIASSKQGASAKCKSSGRKYFWPQNQIPDRFWNYVDEFAGTIGRSDTSTLKRLIEETDPQRSSEYYEQPPTGKHYSLRNGDASRTTTGTAADRSSLEQLSDLDTCWSKRNGLFKKYPERFSSSPTSSHNASKYGGISAVQDNLKVGSAVGVTTTSDAGSWLNGYTCAPAKASPTRAGGLTIQIKSVDMNGTEKRITRSASVSDGAEDGYVENASSSGDASLLIENGCDEVLGELYLRQAELRAIQSKNHACLLKLLARAEAALSLEPVSQKLVVADSTVVDLFQRFYGDSALVRRPLSKKEQEQLWRAIRDRKKILEDVDARRTSSN